MQECLTYKTLGVFNEQRTGKTPMICRTIQEAGIKRCLIVCPASLVYTWKEEFERWTGLKAFIIPDTKFVKKDFPDDCTAVIVNYEKLRGHKSGKKIIAPVVKELLKCKLEGVVADEAHRMKTRDSLTTAALRKFRTLPYRFALTGTPAPNRPWDIWTILNWIQPQMYSSYWAFAEQYFNMEAKWGCGGEHKAPTEFKPGHDKLLAMNVKNISIQRKRADVMPWASDLDKPTLVRLPLKKRQEDAITALQEHWEYKDIIPKNILELLIRIRQICSCPELLGIRCTSPKIEWLLDYLSDYPEKSIIIFSNSTKFLKVVLEKISGVCKCACIIGETDKKVRHQLVQKFQNCEIKVLLIQTQAGKEGLTLDQADTTIFLDTYPPAADYSQAKDRMVATSPERVKPKEIIHVMMKNTYDEALYDLVEHNVSVTEVVNDYKHYLERR